MGLHHFALRVADDQALAELYDRLAETAGVAIELAPEALGTSACAT